MKIALYYSLDSSSSVIVRYLKDRYDIIGELGFKRSKISYVKRVFKRKNVKFRRKLSQLIFFAYYFIFLSKEVDSKILSLSKSHQAELKPDLIVKDANDSLARKYVLDKKPSILIILGLDLLNKEWLEIGIPIINIHTGITPFYRGRFCWFWPIYDKEFDKLGVTTHFVDAGIDTGEIISQKFLNLSRVQARNIASILVEIVKLIQEVIDDSIQKIQDNKVINKTKQSSEKRKFKTRLEPSLLDYLKFKKNLDNYYKNNF